MSVRPRRALVGLVAGVLALAALPATAMAAGETLTVTPTNTQAGGGTDVTATQHFAAGDTPTTVVTSLAPGMLGNLNANPSCLAGQQLNASCQIGTATVKTDKAGNLDGTLYLVPAQGTDASGIEFVPTTPPPGVGNQYIGVTLNPNTPGSLNLTTTFTPITGVNVTDFVANFTSLNGQPFTRLPSSCSAATSTFTVKYASGASAGPISGSFTPTGCATEAYAPKLSATVTKDSHDAGAAVMIGITQAATESASKSIVLQLPKGLQPNAQADLPCLTTAGCKIGTATATSPLVPNAALASGTLTLSGSSLTPTIAIAFPAPFAVTINGTVSLATNSVTFAAVPDLPLTGLTLNITGPSGGKAFNTDCSPASIGGTFTPQSGAAAVAVVSPITFSNCAVKPTASGSTVGLAGGHPKLKFKIAHGQGAADVAAVAIGLPRGLTFSRSAIVSHKVCTTKNKKKKCSTTTLIKGLGIAGGKAKTVAIKGGNLVITLSKPAGTVTITVSGPLLSEAKSLQTSVTKHKVKSLNFTLKVTDANRTATMLPLKLSAH